MAKIRVIEAATEVSWTVTYQGKVRVNGKDVDYRFYEDQDGSELYVLEEGTGWTAAPVDLNTYDILLDVLLEKGAEELKEEGDEFEFDLF